MKLSAGVMAHPSRAADVEELLGRLDREVPVHWDGEGPASGNGDRVWRQARETWLMFDPAADWHVLIQDDAIVCADFLAGLERALDFVPQDAVVSPYLGTGRNVPIRWDALGRAAETSGASFVQSDRVLWGVCLVVPTQLIPEMVEFGDRKSGMPDDMRVGAWAQRRHGEVWYPWPSLVDHKPVPSLTKHRAADRHARLHHEGSALDLVWSGPVVSDPMFIRRRGPRSGPSRLRSVRSEGNRGAGKAGNRA